MKLRAGFLSISVLIACLVFGTALPAGAAESSFVLHPAEWRWSTGDAAGRADPAFDDSGWTPLTLPAALKQAEPGSAFWLRGRIELPPDSPDRLWLKLGKSFPAAEVYVDGAFAGARGSLPPDYSLGATRSSLFLLPGTARPGASVLVAIRCAFKGSTAELKSIEVLGPGPAAVEAGAGLFWNGTLYVILAALCLFIGLYSLLQRIAGTKEASDLYYGGAMLFLSLYLYELGSDRLIVEAAWIRALGRSSLVLSMSLIAPFFMTFFGFLDSKVLRRASLGVGAAFGAAFLAVSGNSTAVETVFVFSLIPVIAVILFCAYVSIRAIRARSGEAWVILAAVIVGLVLAGYDSYFKASGKEPFAWLQGIAFFCLNAAIFAAISMRQARLKSHLAAYARESEEKKAELAGYLGRIVDAGKAVAAIAGELDAAASSARDAAVATAESSRAIDGKAESQARSAARTDELVAGFAESAGKVDASLSAQAAGIERTAAAATELCAGAESVAGNIEQAAAFTAGLAALTAKGQDAARALELSMEKIQESSRGIGEIVEAVNQFAEKTNLLAMNAAIEAAHAGLTGRGFAIIANEVKKLAQAQTERAEAIKAEIGGIATKVAEGARESAKARSALAEIATGASGAAERLAEVGAGTKEQAAASMEIRDAMSELAATAASIRDESQKQAKMAEGASSAVAAVAAEASGLHESARSIAGEGERLLQATRRLIDLAARCRELTDSLASSGKA